VIAGTFVEGEGVLLAAGALCYAGVLSLPAVLLSAFLGSFAWTEFWFQTGRRLGRVSIDKRPAWRARANEFERCMRRYGSPFSCAVFVSLPA